MLAPATSSRLGMYFLDIACHWLILLWLQHPSSVACCMRRLVWLFRAPIRRRKWMYIRCPNQSVTFSVLIKLFFYFAKSWYVTVFCERNSRRYVRKTQWHTEISQEKKFYKNRFRNVTLWMKHLIAVYRTHGIWSRAVHTIMNWRVNVQDVFSSKVAWLKHCYNEY